jgi:hypothetical protein
VLEREPRHSKLPRSLHRFTDLQEEIGKRRPGDKVNLTLRTEDGTEVIKEILLRSADGETVVKSKEEMSKTPALGGTFAELTAKEKKELTINYGGSPGGLSKWELVLIGVGISLLLVVGVVAAGIMVKEGENRIPKSGGDREG